MNSLARFFLCAVALFAFLTFGCSPNLRKLPQKSEPQQTAAAGKPDSTNQKCPLNDTNVGQSKPGLLSGIGGLFSTPEGVARRQAVKLAKAAVPKKLAKGAVYAVNADVVNSYKPQASTTASADSGAVVQNTGGGAAAAGKGASASGGATIQAAPGPLAALTGPTGKVIGGAVAVALLAGGIYLFILWRKKKQAQSIIS